jgi:hypothetical protein
MLADAREGDVALFMSNGPFEGLKERFLVELKSSKREPRNSIVVKPALGFIFHCFACRG